MRKMKFFIGAAAGILLLSGFLFAGSMVLYADESGPVLLAQKDKDTGEEAIESEDDFWGIFRRIFTAEEPEYEDEVRHTEVAGVRGIEREGQMDKTYDFDSVRWMEEFQVKPDQVKNFLENGELGPYKGKGKGKEKES